MKRAAIGIRVHSGWAAVVAVTGDLSEPQILGRERIPVVASSGPRANQPYHFAKDLPLAKAETHLANYAKAAKLLAAQGLERMMKDLREKGYEICCCGILTASGRTLPPLEDILASHAMIHTAEGKFFRDVFAGACNQLGIAVAQVRERELSDRAAEEWRLSPPKIQKKVAAVGHDLGPPWSRDQKSAALAAWLLLSAKRKASAVASVSRG